MPLGTMLVQTIYVLVALMGFALAAVLWRNPDRQGAVPLAVVNLGLGWWSLCLFVSTVAGETLALVAIRVMYLGVLAVPIVMFVFGLVYTGRERYVTRRILALIAVHPLVSLVFVFANPNDLFFRELNADAAFGVEQVWGPAFYAHTLVSYAFATGLTLMILDLLIRSERSLYRGQAIVLFLAILAPWLSNAVFIADLVSFDSTPIGFGISTALFTFAIVRYQLVDVAPIAKEKVLDNIRDGVFIVDTGDRVIDTNPAARRLVGLPAEELVGMRLPALFDDIPQVLTTYEELTAEYSSSERTLELGDLFLNIEATPIEDDRGRHVGWLLLTEDVTEEKRNRRRLERQLEKLDQFASLVSHDLRNPINVARGYVEQTKETGDLAHLEKTETAMNRMETIIDDVLALAREGQEVTDPSETALETVVEAAWETVETKGATLELTDEVREAVIMADSTRLQRLFENLFRNSIEHGIPADSIRSTNGDLQADHTVTVSISSQSATELSVVVADDGVGISPSDRENVFEGGYSTNEDGTGLGLSIVRQIARAHGWSVSAVDSTLGGAAFELSGVRKPLPTDRPPE